jgi:hypothetical protein
LLKKAGNLKFDLYFRILNFLWNTIWWWFLLYEIQSCVKWVFACKHCWHSCKRIVIFFQQKLEQSGVWSGELSPISGSPSGSPQQGRQLPGKRSRDGFQVRYSYNYIRVYSHLRSTEVMWQLMGTKVMWQLPVMKGICSRHMKGDNFQMRRSRGSVQVQVSWQPPGGEFTLQLPVWRSRYSFQARMSVDRLQVQSSRDSFQVQVIWQLPGVKDTWLLPYRKGQGPRGSRNWSVRDHMIIHLFLIYI